MKCGGPSGCDRATAAQGAVMGADGCCWVLLGAEKTAAPDPAVGCGWKTQAPGMKRNRAEWGECLEWADRLGRGLKGPCAPRARGMYLT